MALAFLFAGYSAAQAPQVPTPLHLAHGLSLQLVTPFPTSQPPNFLTIEQANKARVAAQEAAQRVQEAQAALAVAQQAQASYIAPTQPGNCASWLAAAGITDTADAITLINMESGCNPWAVNPYSGACGVAQELPCGKSGCSLGDGACEVAWMNRYVLSRYTSWAAAVAFHLVNNYY